MRGRERGAVTAELAVGLVGVVLALAAVLSVTQVVLAQVRCTDAAAAGARAAARGEDTAAVTRAASALAGAGAVTDASIGAGRAEVRVTAVVDLLLPGAPAVPVTGRAVALVEAGVAGAPPGAP